MTARQENILQIIKWSLNGRTETCSAEIRRMKSDVKTSELKDLERLGHIKSRSSNNRQMGTVWSLA